MARVWTYCIDPDHAPCPVELETAHAIRMYGGQSVFGRVMTLREMRRISLAERIHRAYLGREASKGREGGIAAWAEQNKDENHLLNTAMLAAEETE